jgi:hypothetical protein
LTRSDRNSTPEDEKAFIERVNAESSILATLQKELDRVRSDLADERVGADAAVAGEDAIRAQFLEKLRRQHEVLASVEQRAGPDAARLIHRAHEIRLTAGGIRERLIAAKATLRGQVAKRGRQIHDKVAAVQSLLSSYSTDVASVSGEARNLVGRIAFDSFKRVRQQFYDLVLKADVGLVDVAFTRKHDKTAEIQKLSLQKEQELKVLDNEFREVLKDVD